MFQYQVESHSKFLAIILSWDRSTSEFLTWHDKFFSCYVKIFDVDLSHDRMIAKNLECDSTWY